MHPIISQLIFSLIASLLVNTDDTCILPEKKMYFTIIIGDMGFYCNLLVCRTSAVYSGKVSVRLLNSSWDEPEEIITDMNGSRIVTKKNIEAVS